jgi:hypothetical protein
VTDDRDGTEPPLGELNIVRGVNARQWQNGASPFPKDVWPEQKLIGNSSCIEVGELYPPVMPTRPLFAGVDCRCFHAPSPCGLLLWLRPEDVANFIGPGNTLQKWVNAIPSAFGDWTPSGGLPVPIVQNTLLDIQGVLLSQGNTLGPTQPQLFGVGYSLYIVAILSSSSGSPTGGPACAANAIPLDGIPSISPTVITYQWGFEALQVVATKPGPPAGVWHVRYDVDIAAMGRLGFGEGPLTPPPADPPQVDFIYCTPGFPTPVLATIIVEVLGYDHGLSDEEHVQVLAYLAARYPAAL